MVATWQAGLVTVSLEGLLTTPAIPTATSAGWHGLLSRAWVLRAPGQYGCCPGQVIPVFSNEVTGPGENATGGFTSYGGPASIQDSNSAVLAAAGSLLSGALRRRR